VQVLTSVGLEHTRWLGPTVRDIAGEKLDVVRPGATLVLGAGLDPEVRTVAERIAQQRGAQIVQAGTDPGVEVGAPGAYQRRNFALALAAARAYLGHVEDAAVRGAAASVRVPGRLQQVGTDPLTLFDGAHNPDGVRALVEALAELRTGRERVVAVVSILEDKDAAGMLAALGSASDALVLTSSRNPRALPPPTLRSLVSQLGGPEAEIVPEPDRALHRGRELAGPDGLVVATGSIYLIADLLAPAGDRRASIL
jgi:dihydrofolate synthase/folylpolyglutamate synthase